MLNWLDTNGLRSPVGRGYGLARDNPSAVAPEACRYDACVDLDPLFEERAGRELGIQTLPGGPYVRSRKKGDYADVTRFIMTLHNTFQPHPGLRLDDKRPIVTIFLEDPRGVEIEELRSDVCVPVSAKVARTRDEVEVAA
jgi:AraC family transcriptional regulator